jgi:hypothetical protein
MNIKVENIRGGSVLSGPIGSGGKIVVLHNVGVIPHHYMASQPRRPKLESSLL